MASGDEPESPLHWSWAAIITDPVRLVVLRSLCELRAATVAELCEHCHSSEPTVRRHLDTLRALGLIRDHPGERDGMTPGRPARHFNLDAEAAMKICALFDLLKDPLVSTPEPERIPCRAR